MINQYRITSNYGWRTHPISGKRKFHAGIDVVKKHRAPIESFTSGKVLYAGWGQSGTGVGGYGNVVLIQDVSGRGHLYAHLHQVHIRKEQSINVGSIIGTQGASGNVTGSHLHYEVRKKTSPSFGWSAHPEKSTVNPVPFMKKQSDQSGGKRVVKKINVDGRRGKATISRWQQFLGTPVDGVISRPSVMIQKKQEFLNKFGKKKIKIDGYEGKNTIEASQLFFGTPVDGKISNPSVLIKAEQRFLNMYGQ